MRILVYGAGVLGSLYAAWLRESGLDVSILARGQRLADIRQYGIQLEDTASGHRTITPINAVETFAPEDDYDLVVVLVRKNQVATVLPALAANKSTPSFLFMINNAAGPDEYISAVGRERVLLGFAGAGGEREGHVVRHAVLSKFLQPTSIGELNGCRTSRIEQIGSMFRAAGFPPVIHSNMDAWLKTHVALVSPIANAIYMAGGDNCQLARDPDGVALMLRAIREGFRTLRVMGIPITPFSFRSLEWIPEILLVPCLQRVLNTRWAELVMARHANAARDEMRQLADEFRTLAQAASAPTPAIDRLYTYIC